VAKKTNIPHHGELVYQLWVHSGLNQDDFTRKFGRHRSWIEANRGNQRIFGKTLGQIAQAFNIPVDYFEGKFTLRLSWRFH
jgi:transcriptional regulator with XRE-family HTH domain